MAIAYFDCASGVAGDMVLGALVDAGMPLSHLKKELRKIQIGSYSIEHRSKSDRGFKGANINVIVKEEPHHGDYLHLDATIKGSALSKNVKELSRAIFENLARAEAFVHGKTLDHVHFHEVGAVDSVVDVVGAAIGFDYFKFDSVHSSPVPFTRGTIECAHGTMSIPAPATLELMKGIAVEKSKIKGEVVTPTGLSILKTVAQTFGECPIQVIEETGLGFGDRVIPGMPNALRLIIGEGFPAVQIETNIDDMNPQIFEHVMDGILKRGAADVHLAPIQMKKNRPAILLSAISPWDKKDCVIDFILRETTTFGVRFFPVERKILTRELVIKKTKYGNVHFKLGYDSKGRRIKAVPEYEDVKKLARKKGVSMLEIYEALHRF